MHGSRSTPDLQAHATRRSAVGRRSLVLALVPAFLLTLVAPVAGRVQAAGGSATRVEQPPAPALTTIVPRFVTGLCERTRALSPIRLVCPPLVPVTKYRRLPGLSGALLGNTNIPVVQPPASSIYLLGFNNGDGGPAYWHWLAGMGTPQAIRYWVLSDARNEVKGKPRRVEVLRLKGRRVEIWRFPDYPAGGQLGSHVAAITRSGPYLAIASIHGYDSGAASVRMAVALAREADAAR